jgi:hypothetical protein
MFCAAVPLAAAAGVNWNAKQLAARRQAEAVGAQGPAIKPVMQITMGVVAVLVLGSATYHTLTYLP